MEDRNGPASANHSPYPAATYPYPTAGPPPPSHPYYNYPPNYPYHYQPQPRRASFSGCILAFIVGLGFIFVVTTLIVWIVLRPEIPDFRIDSFSLSNLTFTNGSRVLLTCDVQLTARNPNSRLMVSYDNIEARVYYKYELLSHAPLSPFSQGMKNETSLVARFAGEGSFVEQWVVDGVNGEMGKSGKVELDVRMASWINFESKGGWMSRNVLKVYCGDLTVGIPIDGKPGGLVGGPRPCRVGI